MPPEIEDQFAAVLQLPVTLETQYRTGPFPKSQLKLFPESVEVPSKARILMPGLALESLTSVLRTLWTAPVASTRIQADPSVRLRKPNLVPEPGPKPK